VTAFPEYVVPILAASGPVAFAIVILRFGPDAVLRLLAGAVAVCTKDEKRGARCLEVLRILRGKDSPPSDKQHRALRTNPTGTAGGTRDS
jgi:hypothetical protein